MSNRLKNVTQCLSGAIAAIAVCSGAQAQLMGNDVTAEWRWPNFTSVLESHVVTVSGATELTADDIESDTKFEIDLGEDWVEFRFNALSNWSNNDFNGWYFADTNGTIATVTGYSIDSFSSGIGGTGSIVTGFTDDEFWADFGGMTVAGPGDFIRMKVEFGTCLDMTVSALVAGQNATWNVTGATPNTEVAIVYGLRPGSTSVNGFGGYCADFGINGVDQTQVVCRKTSNGAGDVTCNKGVPGNVSGLRVLTQAAEKGTCPDSCMSNIDTQTIQ